jgi:protoporphyrinogen oxidase
VIARRGAFRLMAGTAAAGSLGPLGGCKPGDRTDPVGSPFDRILERLGRSPSNTITGGFAGASYERGHRLRDGGLPAPDAKRRTSVAIVGGGIAGLSAARQLEKAGVGDYRIFELEDEVGGNSRAGQVGGLACPWGAHYLPVPDQRATDLRELLAEFGLLRIEAGAPVFDERTLCHAPQERLLIGDRWQSGLLPQPFDDQTLNDYRKFAERVNRQRAGGRFGLPSDLSQASGALAMLDRQSFSAWLDEQGLRSAALRWYLDYCCRDDYGARLDEVSAWAGVHYFASRHGLFVPGADRSGIDDYSEVLTWPQGNGWLVERLATPHREHVVAAAVVNRIEHDRSGATLDVWLARENRSERWYADFVIVAVPLFVAARLLAPVPPALAAVLPKLHYAVWLVANLYLPSAPKERPGAPRAWDNAFYDGESLGYVDAMHQSLQSRPGATVFTFYQSLGPSSRARKHLYESSWRDCVDRILLELQRAHPDIRERVAQADVMRWGHAMLVPSPGLRSDPAFAELAKPMGRVHLAHSDLAGYSVFEEAFAHGTTAGHAVATAVKGS